MLRVNNQDVESIEVYNEEDYENIKSFKIKQDDDIQIILKEIYEFIKHSKQIDDREFGYKGGMHYYIELETINNSYGPYKIVKLRNNDKYKITNYTYKLQ